MERTKDCDAISLSQEKSDCFSVRTVESQEANQILLQDLIGITRSWLMVQKCNDFEYSTRLDFALS